MKTVFCKRTMQLSQNKLNPLEQVNKIKIKTLKIKDQQLILDLNLLTTGLAAHNHRTMFRLTPVVLTISLILGTDVLCSHLLNMFKEVIMHWPAVTLWWHFLAVEFQNYFMKYFKPESVFCLYCDWFYLLENVPLVEFIICILYLHACQVRVRKLRSLLYLSRISSTN